MRAALLQAALDGSPCNGELVRGPLGTPGSSRASADGLVPKFSSFPGFLETCPRAFVIWRRIEVGRLDDSAWS